MNIDTFIEIGSQHQMCEDYIISGDNYIILADGCSSSDHSEMGARFLCYMTKQFMKLHRMDWNDPRFPDRMGAWIIHNAEMLARQLGLHKTCLDATLIVAYIKDEQVNIHMFGDGYVVVNRIWEPIYEIYSVEYKAGSKSMPFYLRYKIDEEGLGLYHSTKVTKTLHKNAMFENLHVNKEFPREYGYDHVQSWSINIEEGLKSVSICSDGLGTFLRPHPDETGNKIIEVESMIPSMFDFKNPSGVFLQRQMNICKRKLKKNDLNFEHFDDLSIGTFIMEEDPNAKDGQTD